MREKEKKSYEKFIGQKFGKLFVISILPAQKSRNLLNYYTGSSPGIYACGDSSGGGTGNWSTSHGPMKQELMSGIFVHKL